MTENDYWFKYMHQPLCVFQYNKIVKVQKNKITGWASLLTVVHDLNRRLFAISFKTRLIRSSSCVSLFITTSRGNCGVVLLCYSIISSRAALCSSFGRINDYSERLSLAKNIWHVYSTDLAYRLSSLVPFVRVDARSKKSIDNDPRKKFERELKYTVTNVFERLITKNYIVKITNETQYDFSFFLLSKASFIGFHWHIYSCTCLWRSPSLVNPYFIPSGSCRSSNGSMIFFLLENQIVC